MAPNIPYSYTRPRNDDYTRDVAQRGLAAVQERRNASSYNPTMTTQALEQMLTGASYQPFAGGGDLYQGWQQQRGFMPMGYDLAYGRTDEGDYAGYKTASDLKAALRGTAEYEREQDRARAQALAELAGQRLDEVGDEYAGKRQFATGDDPTWAWRQHMPTMEQVQSGAISEDDLARTSQDNAAIQMELGRAQTLDNYIPFRDKQLQSGYIAGLSDDKNEYNAALSEWLAENSGKYLDATEFANKVEATPLRDYATLAGAQLGIDPMLVRGWYDEGSQITDWNEQRDLASMQQYGVPYSEYERALNEMQGQQADQQDEMDQASRDALYADIEAMTGIPADTLLSKAYVSEQQLIDVLNSPEYADETDAIAQSGNDPDTIAEVLAAYRSTDPIMFRVLSAQYGYLSDAAQE